MYSVETHKELIQKHSSYWCLRRPNKFVILNLEEPVEQSLVDSDSDPLRLEDRQAYHNQQPYAKSIIILYLIVTEEHLLKNPIG